MASCVYGFSVCGGDVEVGRKDKTNDEGVREKERGKKWKS